jgi:hypothetical protein
MASTGEFAFGIRAFDFLIRVECPGIEIRDALGAYLFPPLPRTESAPASPDICVRVELSGDGYRVEVDGRLAEFALTVQDAALAAVKALDKAVVLRLSALRAVHAGALLIDGKALLLPGSSHAGKSSLVAELLRRGASHFSDEYALIDDNGMAHAYPRPLLLRNGSPKQSLVLPKELNARFVTDPAPVGWVLALDYVPGASWKIHELSQSEAVLLLLRNTPHEMEKSPGMVDVFLGVAGRAKCFEGERGEAAEAAACVLDLIRHK